MRRIGATPKGHALWTKRDDQTIRAIYPNYVLLVKMLSPRTFKAIKARALGLGVATKRHVWRNSEVSLLRKSQKQEAAARRLAYELTAGARRTLPPQHPDRRKYEEYRETFR